MLLQTIEALFKKYRLFCYRRLFSAVREKPGSLSATEAFSADIIHLLGSPTAHDRREIVLTTSEKFSGYFDENEDEMQKKVAALTAQFTPEELHSAERVLLALGTLL